MSTPDVMKQLIEIRIQKGLTRAMVSKLMGMSKSSVGRMEAHPTRHSSIETLERYAKAIGCRVKFWVEVETEPREDRNA